ncbi:hypothetical protein JKF63_03521 [Porcisia hertigi]|uniref:REH2 DRSM domain-containing protein n=1 Tax=Porcisia hertigi TaxID=2761500 RepID=A0A836IQV7_9TRYP|nr:hypothetical protein JKF63_03521 [Porcisia hertigi]
MQRLCRHPCCTLTLPHLPRLRLQQWRRSQTVNAVDVLMPNTVVCTRRAVHDGGVTQASALRGGAVDQTDPSHSMTGLKAADSCDSALVRLDQADTFSQSRIKNYLQRVGTLSDVRSSTVCGGSNGRWCARVENPPRQLSGAERAEYAPLIGCASAEKAWISSFDLPVDVLMDANIRRQTIKVTGLAMEAKLAVVAACMHAERCLDALNIPLFTSERRQHQRVLQAKAEGRTAPEATAEPLELSSVQLPRGVFLPAATAAEAIRAAGKTQPFQPSPTFSAPMGRVSDGEANTASDPSTRGRGAWSRKHHLRRPARRWDAIKPRYGAEWFVRVALEELATLQSTIFAHNRPIDDGGDDDDGIGEMETVTISASEVQILQPEVVLNSTGAAAAAASPSFSCDPCPRGGCDVRVPATKVLAYEQRLVTAESRSAHVMIDETEGGAFDLVEDELEKWWYEKEIPGSCCLRDPGAVLRVSRYLEGVTGHDFDSSVQTRAAEEDTNVWQPRPVKVGVKLKTWYTMWLDIPGIPVPAIGKATTLEGARDLCAMHAELLLQWFGIHVYDTAREQAMYYDACLRWGRLIAPEPIDPATVDVKTVRLPKPLKEWYRSISKLRARRSERNVAEKLLHLNRVVVHVVRQHLVEVNIIGQPDYAELLSLARPCLRAFMVAMQHPFESAIFCYVYTKDKQYRSTVYLPLPERYGVRGGYCIAATPDASMTLCALHAIDVLCALDVVPAACMEQPRWQRMLEVRESLGLILPASYQYKKRLENISDPEAAAVAALGPPPAPPHSRLRSPPAYRDVPNLAIGRIPPYKEVWRIMLTDADVFDVAPDLHSLNDEATRLRVPCWFDFSQTLFEEFAQYVFGWRIGEQRHGDCVLHYAGPQHYRGVCRPTANNFWMELPLDPAVYGRRVALGRCFSRKGAERMMYIHALRIAHTLRLAPWDTLPVAKLAAELYGNDTTRATLRHQQWKWVCTTLLECNHIDGVTGGSQKDAAVIPEAEVMYEFVRPTDAAPASAITGAACLVSADSGNGGPSTTDLRRVLSPHPVMSRELAVRTLV